MLVPGDKQEPRQQHMGWRGMGRIRAGGEGEAALPLLYQKSMNAKSSVTGYGILTLGPGYPIGPSIPGSPLREEDVES